MENYANVLNGCSIRDVGDYQKIGPLHQFEVQHQDFFRKIFYWIIFRLANSMKLGFFDNL